MDGEKDAENGERGGARWREEEQSWERLGVRERDARREKGEKEKEIHKSLNDVVLPLKEMASFAVG